MNPQFETLLFKFNTYLETKGYSSRTIPEYTRNVERFLNYLDEIEINDLNQVERQSILDYQIRLLDETCHNRVIGAAARSRRIGAVRSFFNFLMKMGMVTQDPTFDLELPRRPKSLPKDILTKKEVGKLLAFPNLNDPLGIRDRAILEVFYSTGIRVSELCNLTINDIDLEHGELRVNQGKNAKDRIVPLGEIACDYLQNYILYSRRKLALPEQSILFVTKNGRKFDSTDMSHRIARLGKRAGLKKPIACHSLRHTCASHLLQGNADIRYIQEILGHASLATTQIYTKVEIADLKKVHHRCHPREQKGVPVNDGWY